MPLIGGGDHFPSRDLPGIDLKAFIDRGTKGEILFDGNQKSGGNAPVDMVNICII